MVECVMESLEFRSIARAQNITLDCNAKVKM